MAITPTGRPAWERVASIESYGGNVNKRNHLSQGVVDALTDVGAEDFSRMVADLAATARTANMAVIVFNCNDGSPAAPTIQSARMMTGIRLTSYEGDAAPSGFPSAARDGDGQVTFTFDSSYTDEFGVVGAFEILDCHGTGHGQTFVNVTCERLSATTVQVTCTDEDGNAVPEATVTLTVG